MSCSLLDNAEMLTASFRHFMLRRSGFATTSHIDNILIINDFALLLLLLRLDSMSSRLLLSMQATTCSIDHFEESHIFQGMKQDPRKKEAIMHMDRLLRAKSSLVARAFLPYMPGSRKEFTCPYIVTIRSIPIENTIILGVRGLLSLSILNKLQDERPSVLQRLEKNYVL